MRGKSSTTRASIALATVVAILLAACERGDSQPSSSATQNAGPAASTASAARSERWSYQDWPTGHYRVVEGWPKPLPDTRHSHDGWTWGSFGGVYAENPDRIWIAMRGELPLPKGAAPWTPYVALNPSRGNATGNGDGITATCEPRAEARMGAALRALDHRRQSARATWSTSGRISTRCSAQLPCGRGPHQIKISPYDQEKHVWIIDDQLHMIYRFTYDGKLGAQQGRARRARPRAEHVRPADRHRVAARRHLLHHRRLRRHARREVRHRTTTSSRTGARPPEDPKNPGPNEFNTVHSIAISADRRLFVVDRGHQRMQVFDENGKFLDMWPLRSPHWPASQNTLMMNHFIDDKGFIWVGDAPTNRILKFDLNGNFLYSWGAPGPQPGRLGCSHGMTTDQLGNLYLADCFAGRVQKFEPIPGADPEKIAGQILRTWDTWKP